MLHLRERIASDTGEGRRAHPGGTLTLPFEERRKSRLRACLDDGREVAVLLPRGTVLEDGACLLDDEANVVVTVRAALETLSVAYAGDRHQLARAAYHLGNRHAPLQLGHDFVAYQHDHVLDDLVRTLGLVIQIEDRPFEPEMGGYGHPHEHGQDATNVRQEH